MKPVIKYYEPGKVITLFDVHQNQSIEGVLLFPQISKIDSSSSDTVSNTFLEKYPILKKIVGFIEQKRQSIDQLTDLIDFQSTFKILKETLLSLKSFQKPSFKKSQINPATIKYFFNQIPQIIQYHWSYLDQLFSKPKPENPAVLLTNEATSETKQSISWSKRFLRYLAMSCLVCSLISLAVITLPFVISKLPFSDNEMKVDLNTNSGPRIGFEKLQKSYQPQPEPTPTSFEYILTVPKIGLESDVTPNVDLADEAVYRQKLKETGVAHALGSYFPGQKGGPVYLFAHSTDTVANISLFNAKFFALKDLERGDELLISYHGKKYKYVITDKKIIEPTDIDSIQQSDAELILQTCWPPGTDWQRLIVFADQQLL